METSKQALFDVIWSVTMIIILCDGIKWPLINEITDDIPTMLLHRWALSLKVIRTVLYNALYSTVQYVYDRHAISNHVRRTSGRGSIWNVIIFITCESQAVTAAVGRQSLMLTDGVQ